ncbi:MAG: cysteine synthase family protein [Candidatus Marinimicrobia bacterium]|nr:cysteine synthase family protein [Candidatus Neomarinimicrobiota bacterium]MCF7827526.1 cysteine synthase family protein [Candidatus Neomarinimicrobiota bacterium]MCF7881612.1 cysteine synthase family protein [Candidatus Neomarinimicrobiota bacterium]
MNTDTIEPPTQKKRRLGVELEKTIGNTPLLYLESISEMLPENVHAHAKAEWFNPGGSVKDRAAFGIIKSAEEAGALDNGKTLLDASSGNTALAYAMIGASRGHDVQLCVPENASREYIRMYKAFGAKVTLTPAAESSDGAIKKARELHREFPDRYFYADQYSNPANWMAHYKTTAPEIWEQTDGQITHFVAGLGTTGTFTGTSRWLREYNPDISLVSVQPNGPLHGLEGLKHMPSAIVPGIYDDYLADENLEIETEVAQSLVKQLARQEGLLVGMSSGAAVAGVLEVGSRLDSGVIVTVFPDNGRRYINEQFWSEE